MPKIENDSEMMMDEHGEEENSAQIADLTQKAEAIKADGEAFLKAAKRLSEEGLKDAEKVLEFAKTHWKSVLAATTVLGVGGSLFTTEAGKKGRAKVMTSMKRLGKSVTPVKSATKTTTKKNAKKAAKKPAPKMAGRKTSAKKSLSAHH